MVGALKCFTASLLLLSSLAFGEIKNDCTMYASGHEKALVNQGLGKVSPNGQVILRTDSNGVLRLNENPVEGKGEITIAHFSPDSTKLLLGWSTGALQLRDVSTQKIILEKALPEAISLAVFSPTGTSVLFADKAGNYQAVEAAGGRKLGEGKHAKALLWADFSQDGQLWATTSSGTQVWIEKAEANQKTEIAHGGGVERARFSADGKLLFTAARDNIARVSEVDGGKEVFQVPHRQWVKDAQATPDGKYLVTSGADGMVQVTDLASALEVGRVSHTGEVTEAKISPDGKWLATSGAEGAVRISALPSTKEHVTLRYVDRITDLAFSPDSKYLGLGTRDGWAKLVDVASSKGIASLKHGRAVTEVSFSADSRWFYSVSAKKILGQEISPICVDETLKFFPAKSELTEGTAIHKKIRETLCPAPFNEENWKALAPDMAGIALPQAIAKSLLYRFQKPGGFEPERHLRSLLAILRSEFRTKEPALVRGALQTVAAVSPALYTDLFQKIPELKDLPPSNEEAVECRTEEERKQIRDGALAYLNFLRARHRGQPSSWNAWAGLAPLTQALATLPPRIIEAHLREIGTSLAESANEQSNLRPLGIQYLAPFATEAAKPLFGRKSCVRTELIPLWKADRLELLALSSLPIDAEKAESKSGIFAKSLAEFPFPESSSAPRDVASLGMPAEIAWTVADQKFVGRLQKESAPATSAQGPSVAWTFPKEKLSGALLLDADAADGEVAAELADRYINYLVNEGFVIAPAKEVSDWEAEVAKGVKSGAFDYFAVEGRWAGTKGAWHLSATKPGEELQLYLAKPGAESPRPGFASWITEREQAGKGPLLYLENFSGRSPAADALDRPGVVGIFLSAGTSPFSVTPANPFYLLLQGLRAGKDFAGMRAALPIHSAFVFPDDPDYRKKALERASSLGKNPMEIVRPDRENQSYVPEKACEEGA